jgi:hypothetical protein
MGKMAWRNVNGEEGLISASFQILLTILAFSKKFISSHLPHCKINFVSKYKLLFHLMIE